MLTVSARLADVSEESAGEAAFSALSRWSEQSASIAALGVAGLLDVTFLATPPDAMPPDRFKASSARRRL